jgi:hypothetical protein
MLAVVNPEAGKAIFAEALANNGKPRGAADATGAKPKAGSPAAPLASAEAVKILQADPSAPVSDIVQPGVIAASPSMADMAAPGLQARAADKTGKAAPRQSRQPQLPQDPQAGHSLFGLIPAPQTGPSAPIFATPRKPIHLPGLGAAVPNPAPIFPRR